MLTLLYIHLTIHTIFMMVVQLSLTLPFYVNTAIALLLSFSMHAFLLLEMMAWNQNRARGYGRGVIGVP